MIQKKAHGTWFHVQSIGIAALMALAVFFTACDNPVLSESDPAARSVTAGTGTIAPVTVTGTVNTALVSTDVVITLVGNTFDFNASTDATPWFINLPAGLSALRTSLSGDRYTATITLSGTPTVVSAFWIRVTIPSGALADRRTPITIVATDDVTYDIRWPYSNWTKSSRDAVADGAVNAAGYGNTTNANVFVVGNRNTGLGAFTPRGTPSDWQNTPIFASGHVSSIVFINGTFYAVGEGGNLASSTDGSSWTPISTGLLGGADIRTIAYGNGNTVIAGTGGQAAYVSGPPSATSNWQEIKGLSPTGNYNSVVFAANAGTNGMFVITGQGALSGYSTDGETWYPTTNQTEIIFPNPGGQSSLKQVTYDPGHQMFVIVGYHKIAYGFVNGSGGINWNGVDLVDILGDNNYNSWLNAVTYANGYFVAGGSLGISISSNDGISWGLTGAQSQFGTPDPTTGQPYINAITYGDGTYLIGGGPDAGPGIAVYNP
jgi:hypothetical protein